MYERNLNLPKNLSSFLFGPRGTGKSSYIKRNFPSAKYIDLLDSGIYLDLLAAPNHLEKYISDDSGEVIIIDEVQRIPELLNEVHRQIENKGINFILTGSSPRKLRKMSSNLLAGRALKYGMFPLTAVELGNDFNLSKALEFGLLPTIYDSSKSELPKDKYLESYVDVYLQEEVLQEGLTRNLANFTRFLKVATFSQGQQLNLSAVARESSVSRAVAESYFNILLDLLLAYEVPVFSKRAKRKLVNQTKFYYFDVGVYNTLRPKGLLDKDIGDVGVLLESLVLQELVATNSYFDLDYELGYWRTHSGTEVDFVLHGESRLIAIEVKTKQNISRSDMKGLLAFKEDYPEAELVLFYGGKRMLHFNNVRVYPVEQALLDLPEILS